MNRLILIGPMAGLLSLALLTANGAAAQLKAATSPEEAVKNVLVAMQTGDVPALLAQLAAPSRTMFEGLLTFQLARENVDGALAEKFGKDPKQQLTVAENLKRTKDIRIVNKDAKDKDKVALTVWIAEEHDQDKRILESNWYAVKDADAWRLLVPYSGGKTRAVTKKGKDDKKTTVFVYDRERTELSGREADYLRTVGPKYKTLMEGLAKGIRSGLYQSRAEAEKAIHSAEGQFRKENPLPTIEKAER